MTVPEITPQALRLRLLLRLNQSKVALSRDERCRQLLFWEGYFLNILVTDFLISFSTLRASAAGSADAERFSVSLATPRKTLRSLFSSTRSTRSVPVVTFIIAAGFV